MSTEKCYHNVILNLFQDLLVFRRLRVKPAMTQLHLLTVDTIQQYLTQRDSV